MVFWAYWKFVWKLLFPFGFYGILLFKGWLKRIFYFFSFSLWCYGISCLKVDSKFWLKPSLLSKTDKKLLRIFVFWLHQSLSLNLYSFFKANKTVGPYNLKSLPKSPKCILFAQTFMQNKSKTFVRIDLIVYCLIKLKILFTYQIMFYCRYFMFFLFRNKKPLTKLWLWLLLDQLREHKRVVLY